MRALAALLITVLALAAAIPAVAGDGGSRQAAKLTFTKRQPAEPTGLGLRIDYVNPDDPDGKPPAVRRVVTKLARGARIDTSVPDRCTASDAELMLLGAAACSAASVVGSGVITVDTGLPGPARFITSDTIFLNNTDELIFLNTIRDSGLRVVTRSRVTRRRTISEAPFLPGAPPDGAAIDTVRFDMPAISRRVEGERRAYITTPGRCPKSRRWVNRIKFTYDDGQTQRVTSRSPCRRSKRSG